MDLGTMAMKGYSTFPQNSSITEASLSYSLESNPGHSVGESYPSTMIQSVYSSNLAEWFKWLIE